MLKILCRIRTKYEFNNLRCAVQVLPWLLRQTRRKLACRDSMLAMAIVDMLAMTRKTLKLSGEAGSGNNSKCFAENQSSKHSGAFKMLALTVLTSCSLSSKSKMRYGKLGKTLSSKPPRSEPTFGRLAQRAKWYESQQATPCSNRYHQSHTTRQARQQRTYLRWSGAL